MTMEIITTCPFCGSTNVITVDAEAYFAWQSGELIQNAMPNLDASSREMLISGICLECQKDIFGDF